MIVSPNTFAGAIITRFRVHHRAPRDLALKEASSSGGVGVRTSAESWPEISRARPLTEGGLRGRWDTHRPVISRLRPGADGIYDSRLVLFAFRTPIGFISGNCTFPLSLYITPHLGYRKKAAAMPPTRAETARPE